MPATEDLAKIESATSLAARIRRKEISPVEAVDAAIARIETHNPKINALVIFGYDDARKAAKAGEACKERRLTWLTLFLRSMRRLTRL